MLFVGDYANGIVWTDRTGVSVDRSVISVPTSESLDSIGWTGPSIRNVNYSLLLVNVEVAFMLLACQTGLGRVLVYIVTTFQTYLAFQATVWAVIRL
jgi:hypothetical protein